MAKSQWTKSETVSFQGYVDAGIKCPEIARRLNKSYTAVYTRYVRYMSDKNNGDDKEIDTKVKIRVCLKCKEEFKSSGPGNRMCNGCKSLGTGFNGTVYC